MWGDDNVVEVGSAQEGSKKGVRIADPIDTNSCGICDVAVSPVHGSAQLPAALYQEERCWADLYRCAQKSTF